MDTARDPELARFLAELALRLSGVREVDKALRVAVRAAREHFRADEAAAALLVPGAGEPAVAIRHRLPGGTDWELGPLADFLAGRRPRLPRTLVVVPLRRQGRAWGALALRRAAGFERRAVRHAEKVGERLGELVDAIDRARIVEVQARLDRKLLSLLRPQDVFYQILHGLKTLTGYDHSASLWTLDARARRLELVAEKIAWRKGKSARIGRVLALEPAIAARLAAGARSSVAARLAAGAQASIAEQLAAGALAGLDRDGDGWRPWLGADGAALVALLELDGAADGDGARAAPTSAAPTSADRGHASARASGAEPPRGSVLVAPLATGDDVLGVLAVASRRPGHLGPYQAELVERFLPHAAVAVRNLRRTAALEERMLDAEKKHAMANLARGVSHDVNNAFGAALPLVQQMLHDLREGVIEPETLAADLEQVESSLLTCRRIFGGMVSFARGGDRGLGQGDLGRAVKATLAILADSLRRLGIAVDARLPDRLPAVRGGQGDLEQLALNLLANARDAMSSGGELGIELALELDSEPAHARLTVTDTGVGIPAADLARIQEPFFTTKREGSGLGLAICRSIVWDVGGELAFQSQPGAGTRVVARLPLAEPPADSPGPAPAVERASDGAPHHAAAAEAPA